MKGWLGLLLLLLPLRLRLGEREPIVGLGVGRVGNHDAFGNAGLIVSVDPSIETEGLLFKSFEDHAS